MLKSIRLHFGPTASASLTLQPAPMTVFIGADAQQRQVLDALERALQFTTHDQPRAVVAELEPGLPPAGRIRERLLAAIKADLAPLRSVNAAESAVLNTLVKVLRDPDVEPETLEEAGSWLEVTGKRDALAALVARHRLRPPAAGDQATLEFIHTLIGRGDEALIASGQIDLRGYHDPSMSIRLTGAAVLALAERDPATYTLDHPVILLDALEVDLAPALAHRFGDGLGEFAAMHGLCIFAAMRDPEFLRGCLEAGRPVAVVRLGEHEGHITAELLAHHSPS